MRLSRNPGVLRLQQPKVQQQATIPVLRQPRHELCVRKDKTRHLLQGNKYWAERKVGPRRALDVAAAG